MRAPLTIAVLTVALVTASALPPASPVVGAAQANSIEYYSTNGRVLTVEYNRSKDAAVVNQWEAAYAIPLSRNYSFEITDIQAFHLDAAGTPLTNPSPYLVRIVRGSGVITPVHAQRQEANQWRRTGVVLQPGDELQIRSNFNGPNTAADARWIINGNVTR